MANFSHIIELRPDYVKLDISLVRNVNDDFGRQAMVAGIRHFARTAGCDLIAEGIETPEEALTLTRVRRPVRPGLPARAPGARRNLGDGRAPQGAKGSRERRRAAASAVADLFGQLEPAHPVADARPHLPPGRLRGRVDPFAEGNDLGGRIEA